MILDKMERHSRGNDVANDSNNCTNDGNNSGCSGNDGTNDGHGGMIVVMMVAMVQIW